MKVKLWAILDIQKEEARLCYSDEERTKGAIAVFDKKPKIKPEWQDRKKVARVEIYFDDIKYTK